MRWDKAMNISPAPQQLPFSFSLFLFLFFLLFVSAYNVWVISPPLPLLLPLTSHPLPLPATPWLPHKNYFALISNFVEERV
jgi:hypothetical protein